MDTIPYMRTPLSMLLLNRSLSLIAFLGLGALICTLGVYQYTEVNYLQIFGAVAAGYVAAFFILQATRSMIELVMMIGLIAVVVSGMVYLAGNTFTDGIQLVLWGIVCGAGYAPMILIGIGQWETPERRQELMAKDAARRY